MTRDTLIEVMLVEQSPALLKAGVANSCSHPAPLEVAESWVRSQRLWDPSAEPRGQLEKQQLCRSRTVPLSPTPEFLLLPNEGMSLPGRSRVAQNAACNFFSCFGLTENPNPGGFTSQNRYLILLIGDF